MPANYRIGAFRRSLPYLALFAPIALFALLISTTSQVYNPFRNTLLYNVPFIVAAYHAWRHSRISQDRWAWRLISFGVLSSMVGNLLYDAAHYYSSPLPWWASDAASLMLPLCMYGAITLLVRARVNVWQPSTALDGLIIAFGAAALLYQTVYAPLLSHGDKAMQSIVYAAYPIADLMLIALAASASFLLRHGLRSGWGALHMAFIAFTVTDTAFLYDAADKAYSSGGMRDTGWMIAVALIGVAALSRWQNRGVENIDASSVIFWPVSMSFIMIAYLAGGVMHGTSREAANMLGLACLAMTVARVALTIREGHKMFSMRRESRTDEVTGLGNRRSFDENLAKAVARQSPFALIMMDLDGFKQINDGFGHEIGDMVLIEVAKRIDHVTPENTVSARIGGDEFALIVQGAGEDRLRRVADQLLSAIQGPYVFEVQIGEQGEILTGDAAQAAKESSEAVETNSINATIGVSIGCSLYPRDGGELELVRFADSAMYQIKKSGGGVNVHKPMGGTCEDIHANQFQMLKDLRQALHRDSAENRLTVHYQPIEPVNPGDPRVIEALVRWQRDGQLVPPGAFISLAETGGLMQKMTEKVLDQSLADLAEQRTAGHDLSVSVNLAVSSLLDPTLMDTVRRALARHDVPATCLKLEITESMIILDPRTAKRTVDALRELGVGVMIDDYGTGYSSIAHLQQLNISGLKIDRSFVADMLDPDKDRVQLIVQSVIDMARAMDIHVVAEGVETAQQLQALTDMGCNYIQGFYIARPMPADKLSAWFDRHQRAPLREVA
jgi:diguanylate cyclase (GGDEF)-like protein